MSGNLVQMRVTASDAMARAESAHAALTAHEDICAVRYGQISDILVELKSDIKDQHKLLWGVLLTVCGFLAVTMVAIVLRAIHLA